MAHGNHGDQIFLSVQKHCEGMKTANPEKRKEKETPHRTDPMGREKK